MSIKRARTRIALTLVAVTLASFFELTSVDAWGDHGHRISGRAAATNLPLEMPSFFRTAASQLEYLNPEPDRWRERALGEMNEAFRYDHYLDLEVVPQAALDAEDRFAYLAALYKAGLRQPEKEAGLLPFRILELYQRLLTEFRLWRKTSDVQTREWIQQRIINDAGLLGHYVTDGANPHHTTVHHNGWAKGYPNPNGYTTDDTFHSRFETRFVGAKISPADLLVKINPAPVILNNARAEILVYLRDSNNLVERLYQLDNQAKFDAQTTAPANKTFAVERLTAGVEMLRSLWWTAWVKSAPEAEPAATVSQPLQPSRSAPRTPASQPQSSQPKQRERTAPLGATAECNDGTYSFSQNRRGTCSHHGGVRRWLR